MQIIKKTSSQEGEWDTERVPDISQRGYSQNMSNEGNFSGALNTDNLTDRPEMAFF